MHDSREGSEERHDSGSVESEFSQHRLTPAPVLQFDGARLRQGERWSVAAARVRRQGAAAGLLRDPRPLLQRESSLREPESLALANEFDLTGGRMQRT
ncbi:hypothetical protein [Agrococcus sp. Marseille-Q4369]|uniref:hypothetical protein n=1 Tax=Agrococcus sp. Marseille-Q4369 TaxID=2810513 RepID=UPI001B8CEE3E|nr:hypothetical protein [Agrococcus sp. Marseille-Q4369]QUW17846.1 hypothetical protein JSQ78_08195 [Agrococcus sp. Marseille-Q4369]